MEDVAVARADDLLERVGEQKFATVLADPPWRFHNSTGKMAPTAPTIRRAAQSFVRVGANLAAVLVAICSWRFPFMVGGVS